MPKAPKRSPKERLAPDHGVRLASARLASRVFVEGSGFRVQGSGFRVQGSGFRVQGLGFRV